MAPTGKRLAQELREAGVQVTDVWQLVRARTPYPDAIPVLIRWVADLPHNELPVGERDQFTEGVVRALSVKEARPAAAPALLKLFPRTTYPIQWVVGNAIEITASPDHVDDVLRLVEQKQHGQSRQMLVLALRRIGKRDPRTVDVLVPLVDDDDVAAQAISVLASLRPDLAAELAGPKVDHPVPMIRQAARKAVRSAGS